MQKIKGNADRPLPANAAGQSVTPKDKIEKKNSQKKKKFVLTVVKKTT
jgi:hypothetical protein